MTDYERGKRAGMRMAITAIKDWYKTAHRRDSDDMVIATSWEVAQGAARAVSRLLHYEDPKRDPHWGGWPEPSHHVTEQ